MAFQFGTNWSVLPSSLPSRNWQRRSLAFMFWGEGLFVFPVMLFYTAISSSVFRGKVSSAARHHQTRGASIAMERPLSPFMFPTWYRFQITSVLSILHRLTGIALAVGSILLAWWLVAVPAGGEVFSATHAFIASPIGELLLFGWSVAFFYHCAAASGISPGMPATASRSPPPIAAATLCSPQRSC